jgi:outer membrane protein OmpA-like peptidoglycan-associated protein
LHASVLVCGSAFACVSALAQTNPAPPAAAPPTPMAFEEALLKAANTLFSKANLQDTPDRVPLVIDPLIDGATSAQSTATMSMEQRISDLVRNSYRRFELMPLTSEVIGRKPVVLIGTFTAINNAGVAGGPRDVYRICLALADLKENRIIAKGATRALPEGIDVTPTAFFEDSPVSANDPATDGYIRSCQASKLGGPVDPAYTDRIRVAALVNDGIKAYNAKKFTEALDHYESALRTPGGEQLRVLNGLYLANWKLNRREAARQAFGRVVDYGLGTDRLAVRFVFRPNSAQFTTDAVMRSQFNMWVQEIGQRTAKADKCLNVVGHTSATGSVDLNERLSLQRAEYVMEHLQNALPGKRDDRRFLATGVGSRELIVGTGKDDASDALDRRVEFRTVPCTGLMAAAGKPTKAAEQPAAEPARQSKKASAAKPPAKTMKSAARARLDGGAVKAWLPAVQSQVRRYLRAYGVDMPE